MKKCGFLGGKEAIKSLRSSGYRDTPMAIGELIDNSIQAGADKISVVLTTDNEVKNVRTVQKITSIAVIDNGNGMDPDKLQSSLVLGEGTNRNEEKGMGKFGVGLPQSSISQAKRVDAWSWTDGIQSMKHVYIDLDDEEWLNDAEIKDPDDMPFPYQYDQFINEFESGTLILWTDVDRISWKKANTVFQKCENQIGRMYRYWLNDGKIDLKMITIDASGKILGTNEFRAIDPLFLMDGAKCGNPPETPMFKNFVNNDVRRYKLVVDGIEKEVAVTIKASLAKDTVRLDGESAGDKDYGKIAKECIGVSIVREGRELELRDQWHMKTPKDPRHRWWGVEISFTRDLDDVFGVTNNKQSATKINEWCKKEYKDILEDLGIDPECDVDRSMKELQEESPADFIVMDVIITVQHLIKQMFDEIESNTRKRKSKSSRHDDKEGFHQKFDTMSLERSKNYTSENDEIIEQKGANRIDDVISELNMDDEYTDDEKKEIISDVEAGHRCSITVTNLDSSSFFAIDRKDTQMILKLNSSHAAYDQMFGIYKDILGDEKTSVEDIKIKAKDAFESVQLLLAAWGRMEEEDRDPKMKRKYREIRERWGGIMEDAYLDGE